MERPQIAEKQEAKRLIKLLTSWPSEQQRYWAPFLKTEAKTVSFYQVPRDCKVRVQNFLREVIQWWKLRISAEGSFYFTFPKILHRWNECEFSQQSLSLKKSWFWHSVMLHVQPMIKHYELRLVPNILILILAMPCCYWQSNNIYYIIIMVDSFGSTFHHLGNEVRTLPNAKKMKSRNLSNIYSSFVRLKKIKTIERFTVVTGIEAVNFFTEYL